MQMKATCSVITRQKNMNGGEGQIMPLLKLIAGVYMWCFAYCNGKEGCNKDYNKLYNNQYYSQ